MAFIVEINWLGWAVARENTNKPPNREPAVVLSKQWVDFLNENNATNEIRTSGTTKKSVASAKPQNTAIHNE